MPIETRGTIDAGALCTLCGYRKTNRVCTDCKAYVCEDCDVWPEGSRMPPTHDQEAHVLPELEIQGDGEGEMPFDPEPPLGDDGDR